MLAAVAIVPAYTLVVGLIALRNTPAADVLDPRRWLLLLANTAAVGIVSLAMALLLGALLGFLIARTLLPGRRLLLGLLLILACLPPYVVVVFLFAGVPLWRFAQSTAACGVVYGLICTPLSALLLATAFRSADGELEDAARLDAREPAVLLRVTLPQALWAVAAVVVLVFVIVATDITVSDALLVRTFAEEVYTQYVLAQQAGGPLLASLPFLVLLAAALLALQWRFRFLGEHTLERFGSVPRHYVRGGARWGLAAACWVAVLLAVGAPSAALVNRLGPLHELPARAWGLREDVLVSAGCGVCAATLIVVVAVGLAWSTVSSRLSRFAVSAALVLLLALPAPTAGISLIGLLNRPGWPGALYDSPAVIVCGYVVRFLPVGILLLIPAARRFPRDLVLAARVDGCSRWQVRRYIVWPAVRRDAAVVWLVLLILCLGEIGCTALVAPPGYSTASVRALTLIHFGVYSDLAVLALVSAGCVLVPAALLLCTLRLPWWTGSRR